MKKRFYKISGVIGIVTLICAFTSTKLVFQNGNRVDSGLCEITNDAFEDGEQLTYKALYSLPPMRVGAGEAVFKAKDEGDTYHFTLDGKTYKSYEWFYKVRDRYESRVDKESMLPILSIRDIKEGGYNRYEENTYDRDSLKVISNRGKSKNNLKLREFDLNEKCIHDVLSIIYAVRNLDHSTMKENDIFNIDVFLSKSEYDLDVRFMGREEDKKIPGLGRFNTLLYSPEVIEGDVFKEKNAMRVWVTDDENRIPLMVQTPLSLGSVKVILKDYKNLKHPLTSEVD